MDELKNVYKDLPQLIVALDSLDDDANYIHIQDAKEGIEYYCPCCKGIVKPRAYKDDKEYQVQAHYYHENGGCNEETFLHYICKTWLFDIGCKFKIEDNIYYVEKIETEKTYETSFGGYRPDITVHTTIGKVFFFEIKYSNKKTEHYIPKWDELGNDVVEVDVRYFINQKFENDIPKFNLIYSNGECFIKTYTRKDYDDLIAKRKLEWKRQDKINYKIMWERLDWFWLRIQDYKLNNCDIENVKKAFCELSDKDKELCFEIIKKMSCIKEYNEYFRSIINYYLKINFTKDYIQNLVDNTVVVNNIEFVEKDRMRINCTYKPNDMDWNINVSHYSKEWIFRYSEIIKLIAKINDESERYIEHEINSSNFNRTVYPAIKNIENLLTNTIWYIKYTEPKEVGIYNNYCKIDIGIKNSRSLYDCKTIYIYQGDIKNIGFVDVENNIIDKLTTSMNEIYQYVEKKDGYGCEYRHMFTGGGIND